MKHCTLANSDLRVSRVGFGCWQLGGHGWGKVSEKEMVNAVNRAIELGINLFDTAPIYGLGHSEELLGQALGNNRKNVVLATKVGLTWTIDQTFQKLIDCSSLNIEREIEASLRRLHTDYIDLYQIHWPDPNTPIEETLAALQKLKQSGKVRYIGCCNFGLDILERVCQHDQFDSLQIRYNLIDREVENDLLPFCLKRGIGVLAHSALANGLLSGKYDATSTFGMDDHRSRDGYFTSQSLAKNMKIVERVKTVANRLGKTPSQIALCWVLGHESVTAVLAGTKNVHQIEENAAAADITLPEEDMKLLSKG